MYRKKLLACCMSALFISACGGGGDGAAPVATAPAVPITPAPAASVGVFLDSVVSGLRYDADTFSGVSNSAGEFNYNPGEVITFSIGDVVIGSAIAAPIMTPLTLVPDAIDETHPVVSNIVRLLLTLDTDGDPNNGITISEDAVTTITGKDIKLDAVNLSADAGVIEFLSEFRGGAIQLVERGVAERHFNETLIGQSSWGALTWGRDTWKKATP